ncbi:MAG: DNA polymerase ligase N-terminal domain-containing protein [Pyrinomonadaceae bacterium]
MRKRFVVHEHHATRLHWDLRLEMAGVLKSWAVPKGPSMNPADKRLAVHVPDHSIEYGKFEGTLAEGTYGAGEVRIWDDGKYETDEDPVRQFERGKIVFRCFGLKLRGEFTLVKMHGRGEENWLLIKARDHFADDKWKIETVLPVKKTAKKKSKKAK